MSVRDEVEILIDDVAFGGSGVGRVDGKAVFVPFTIEGERVLARIVREKKSFAQAELVRLLQSAPQRVMPQCPYFGRCGGCAYQHMSYAHQLRWKERQVAATLERIGKFPAPPMRPIVPSPKEYGYRNRITVHVEDGAVGFFERDAHRLIDVVRCPIAAPQVNEELAALRKRRPQEGHYTLRARKGPRVFWQTNDEVAMQLADRVVSLLAPEQALVVDAYCGAGFFAQRCRGRSVRIVGIDWDIHAIAAARENAGETETYLSGDIAIRLDEQLASADLRRTTVIVDPPATGLEADVRAILQRHAPATLFYVSCNPATLARDLAEIRAAFTLVSVTPFDMFPQTAEIEVLAHLSALDQHARVS